MSVGNCSTNVCRRVCGLPGCMSTPTTASCPSSFLWTRWTSIAYCLPFMVCLLELWEKPRDGRQQLSLVKRLGQIGIRALLHAPKVIGLLVLSGAQDDLDIVCLRVIFQLGIA